MITILYAIMLTVFVTYISFVLLKCGIQMSISDSYYSLKHYKLGWLFTLYIVGFAYPAAIIASNIWITSAAFLIMLVGVARAFRDSRLLKFAHFFGAYGGVALCFGGIWFHYRLYALDLAIITVCIALLIFKKYLPVAVHKTQTGEIERDYSHIFWIEVIIYVSIAYVLHLEL